MARETPGFEIITIPCLSDNYAYVLVGPDTACLIDAPEAEPILSALNDANIQLTAILLTHHHYDHVDGVDAILEKHPCPVIGPKAEEDKMPKLDFALKEGQFPELPGVPDLQVIHVPGHTLGHIAFYFADAAAVFTGDSLMALGCGRLFEGTPDMMWDSMCKLMAQPDETVAYSGHEYTSGNAKFALTIEPDNVDLKTRFDDIVQKCADGIPTAQATLGLEKATNPFLRADLDHVKVALGMQTSTDAEVFAEIRARKDKF